MGSDKSSKDLVIEILTRDYDITAKVIYNKLRHSKNVSYHAVYKTIQAMLGEGILEKTEMNYSLSPEWISEQMDYFTRLNHSYRNRRESQLINKESLHFVLPSIHEGFCMLMRAMERGVWGDDKDIAGHFSHLLYIHLSEAETELLKRLGKERNFYYLVNHKSNLDKMIAYYNKHTFGFKTSLGTPCADPFYLYAMGEYIIQVNIPGDLRKSMDRIYNHPFSATLFPKAKIQQITTLLNEVVRKKTKIHVHVIKDRDAAQEILEKTKKNF